MTRRAYPILGRLNLRLFDATKVALKPVYLRYKILRGRSQDQSGDPGTWTWTWIWTLDLYLDLDPGSQYTQILVFLEIFQSNGRMNQSILYIP